MAKYVINTPLGIALKRVRNHLDCNQADLGKRLLTSRRSIVRWERGDCLPFPADREYIVRCLRDLPREIVAQVAAALDVPLVTPEIASDEAKRALEAHLHAVAESADVSARRARAVVIAVLDKAGELKLSIAQARELLKA